jgi:LmbE family N-acetylglucosaminyl deacetylase
MSPETTSIPDLVRGVRPHHAMVLVAHPDDGEFMCGGTVALLTRAGWTVDMLVATNGNKGTKDPRRTSQDLAAVREEEQRQAAAILGAREPIFLGFGDGELRDDDELRGLVVRELRRLRPSLVITWDGFRPGFNHRDHRNIGRATYDAIWPDSDDHLYFPEHRHEGLEPHRPEMMLLAGTLDPDVYVDIEPVLETKVAAVSEHVSQVGGRSAEQMLRGWRERAAAEAAARGEDGSGPTYREAFRVVTWQQPGIRRSAAQRRGRRAAAR